MIENQPQISQITFGDDGVEIVYCEPRDIEVLNKTGILNTRYKQIPASLIQDEIAELVETVGDMIDRAAIAERNPDARVR